MVTIKKSRAWGVLEAPQSKSFAIRLIFSSLLTEVNLESPQPSLDVLDAIDAVSILGVQREGWRFRRLGEPKLLTDSIYLRGSATVLRMLIPTVAAIGGRLRIDGSESLRRRPLRALVEALREAGVKVSGERLPIVIEGRIREPYVEIYGGESSQYISGFMIAFSLVGGGTIKVRPPLVSKSFVYMTADVMRMVGCKVALSGDTITVEPPSEARPYSGPVPGDYLLSSFFAAAALLTGGEVWIRGLPDPPTYFGDHSVVEIYRSMGATSTYSGGVWYVKGEGRYRPVELDLEDSPDLAPSVAPLAAVADGVTVMRGAERLRIKESDRVESIVGVLRAFGVRAIYNGGSLIVEGSEPHPAVVTCPDDHRIAMMAAALASRTGGTVLHAECVIKSNPSFWSSLAKLGVKLEVRT